MKGRGQRDAGLVQQEERKNRPRQFPAEIPVGITSNFFFFFQPEQNRQAQLLLSSKIRSGDFLRLLRDILSLPETVICHEGWKLTKMSVSGFGALYHETNGKILILLLFNLF